MPSIKARSAVTFLLLAVFLFSCNGNKAKNDFDHKLIPALKDNKWGYIDHDGKWVINPQFELAKSFSEGLAAVQATGGKYGFIGGDGHYVINPQYLDFTHFSEGKAFVLPDNGLPTCIDKDGKTLFTLKDVDNVYNFRNGRARITSGKKVGFINSEGKVCINPQFAIAGDFTDEYASFGIVNPADKTRYLRGFIDREGKIVAAAQFRFLGELQEGLAYASTDGAKYGYVDHKGVYAINQQFDDAEAFSEGLAPVKIGGLWGYTDKTGKLAINPQFEQAGLFSQGLAPVSVGKDNWGYIDQKGAIKINPQFSAADVFHDGVALVVSGTQIGLIDQGGKFKANPQFDGTFGWSDGSFLPQRMKSNLSFVESNYFDDSTAVAKITGNIFSGRGLRGLDGATTYVGVQPYLSTHIEGSNLTSVIVDKDTTEVVPGITITRIDYKFAGVAMKPPSADAGTKGSVPILVGVPDNKITELDVLVNLGNSKRMSGKADALKDAIKDLLIKKGGVSETPDETNSNAQAKLVIATLLTKGVGKDHISFLFGKACQYCISSSPDDNTVTLRGIFADAQSFAPFVKDNEFYFTPEITDDAFWDDFFSGVPDSVKSKLR